MTTTEKAELRTAEYQALREEMLQHMQSEIQLTSFALIFTSSALGLFASSGRELSPETLLLPLPVLWFSIYSVIEHHQQVVTIGTYIHRFFESDGLGSAWEDRLQKFRERTTALLWKPVRFHGFVWFLHTILAVLCVAPAVKQALDIFGSVSPLIVLGGMTSTAVAYHTLKLTRELEEIQPKFTDIWDEIKHEEQGHVEASHIE